MNDNAGRGRRKGREHQPDDVPEPQIFQSRLFRVVTWMVLALLALSVILLLVMALLPMN